MRSVTINLESPDPTPSINAFLWAMHNAKKLGFTPKTEHSLAEQLFRGEVGVLYYSSLSGTISIVEGKEVEQDEESLDDLLEIIQLLGKSRKRRLQAKRDAEAASAVIEPPAADDPEPEEA